MTELTDQLTEAARAEREKDPGYRSAPRMCLRVTMGSVFRAKGLPVPKGDLPALQAGIAEVQPNFNWTPHSDLAELERLARNKEQPTLGWATIYRRMGKDVVDLVAELHRMEGKPEETGQG